MSEIKIIDIDSPIPVNVGNQIEVKHYDDEGTKEITSNGIHNVTGYAMADVSVYTEPLLQSKTATPTESQQSIVPDSGYDGLSNVTVNGISSTYVGTGIARNVSSNLTAIGSVVSGPSGYYSQAFSKAVDIGSIRQNGWSESVSGSNLNMYPNLAFSSGYISSSPSIERLFNVIEKTVTPSTSQIIVQRENANQWLSKITIEPIPSEYIVPSGTLNITSGGTQDVTNYAYVSVPSGTAGQPYVMTEFRTNHTAVMTPLVTNTSGYISGSTKMGNTLTVSASELASGTYNITSNGIYDVTNYASADVSIPSVGHIAMIQTNGSQSSTYVKYNNIIYSEDGSSFRFNQDDIIEISVKGSTSTGTIYLDGFSVASTSIAGRPAQYSLAAPDGDVQIQFQFYSSTADALIATSKYTTIYERLFLKCLESDVDYIQEWCNNFTTIPNYFFEGRNFSGTFTFTNVSSIGYGAFARANTTSNILTFYSSFSFYFPTATIIKSSAFYLNPGIIYIDCPEVTEIEYSAFFSCRNLSYMSFPKATYISSYAFYNCSNLISASFPNASIIGMAAFYNCVRLTSISFPKATTIGTSAFNNCNSLLTTAIFPSVKTIGMSAFQSCYSLTTAIFPNATSIGQYGFISCYKLNSISFPNVQTISGSAFYGCSSLTTAIFPNATTISYLAFASCYKLTDIIAPNVTHIDSYAFTNCSSLMTVSFPKVLSIINSTFNRCYSLSKAIFKNITFISNYAFQSCYNLISLYLPGSSFCSLSSASAFLSTPISTYTTSTGGIYGSIFVPQSLYNSYIAATHWSRFASQFVSLTDAEIENLLYPLQTLVGTSWLLFNTLDTDGMTETYSLVGQVGDDDFSSLEFYVAQDKTEIYIDDEEFPIYSPDTYGSEDNPSNWFADDFKNITITGGTDATNRKLIRWFTDNGMQIS